MQESVEDADTCTAGYKIKLDMGKSVEDADTGAVECEIELDVGESVKDAYTDALGYDIGMHVGESVEDADADAVGYELVLEKVKTGRDREEVRLEVGDDEKAVTEGMGIRSRARAPHWRQRVLGGHLQHNSTSQLSDWRGDGERDEVTYVHVRAEPCTGNQAQVTARE